MSKKAFFVGIKGVGMTALALAMQESGWEVLGSDTQDSFITDQILQARNIKVSLFSDPVRDDLDLIIYSGAYEASHPHARVLSLAEALAEFVKDRKVVAVAGVGGKTTTSSMLATMFRSCSRDVGYYIGTSDVIGLDAPGSSGTDEIFVVEADEYVISKTDKRPKFALLSPTVLITTNIIHDHPDVYESEQETFLTFQKLVADLKPGSIWIASENDRLTQKILSTTKVAAKVELYSQNHKLYDKLNLSVFGDQNKLDALAAVIAGMAMGLSEEEALNGIKAYKGSKRRQEKIGEVKGRLLYDDYGHHPHEVEATINSFKQSFPKNSLTLVFESHTYSRTESLLLDFAKSVALADKIYLMPIFESAREISKPHTITPEIFVEEIKKYNKNVQALTWDNAAQVIASNSQSGDLILTMGAGFVYKLHASIVKLLNL